jgi:hypothetical protein
MDTRTSTESLIIPIDRSKPFDLKAWWFDHLRIKHVDQKAASLQQVESKNLTFGRPYWEPVGHNSNVHIEGQAFASFWQHKTVLLDRLFPQWKMSCNYEWWQCYCDGVVMANEFEIEFVPFFRAVQVRRSNGSIERNLYWGYTPIKYDWGQTFPALVVEHSC